MGIRWKSTNRVIEEKEKEDKVKRRNVRCAENDEERKSRSRITER